jgi:hypothetical protein
MDDDDYRMVRAYLRRAALEAAESTDAFKQLCATLMRDAARRARRRHRLILLIMGVVAGVALSIAVRIMS